MPERKLPKEMSVYDAIKFINFEIHSEEWEEPVDWRELFKPLPADILSLLEGEEREKYLREFHAGLPEIEKKKRTLYPVKVLQKELRAGSLIAYYKRNPINDPIPPERWSANSMFFMGRGIREILVNAKDVQRIVGQAKQESQRPGPPSQREVMRSTVQKLMVEGKIKKSTPIQQTLGIVIKEQKILEGTRGWDIETFRRHTKDLFTQK